MTAGHKWRPLQRSTVTKDPSDELVAAWMQHLGLGRDAAVAKMREEFARVETWVNDLYQVEVRRYPDERMAHINIRRRDGWPGRDWRHFQQIKNEICGPECEAIELYPAESRLVDTSNKYHLWASLDPEFRFPVGFPSRDVQFGTHSSPGLRQRPQMQGAS